MSGGADGARGGWSPKGPAHRLFRCFCSSWCGWSCTRCCSCSSRACAGRAGGRSSTCGSSSRGPPNGRRSAGSLRHLGRERRARRAGRRSARRALRAVRVPGPADPRRDRGAPRRAPAARGRGRVPVPLRRDRGSSRARCRPRSGLEEPPWRLEGAAAILLVHAYSMYVYFYLLVRAALLSLDGAQLEAAASLGASRWRTLRRVVLPALRPALTGAALLTFMTALASFSAPYVFGGGYRVMTTQIVATRLNGEEALAMVETVSLTLLALLALAVFRDADREPGARWRARGRRRRRCGCAAAGARAGSRLLGWGLAAAAPAAASDAGGRVARAGRHLDRRGDSAGVEPGQLRHAGAGSGAPAPAAQQPRPRDRGYGRVGRHRRSPRASWWCAAERRDAA